MSRRSADLRLEIKLCSRRWESHNSQIRTSYKAFYADGVIVGTWQNMHAQS